MKIQKTLMSELQFQGFLGELRMAWKEKRYLKVSVTTDKPRTLPANALSHVWYEQVSRELREFTPAGVKRFCKLTMGVPILRREDEHFRSRYDEVIRPLPYELKEKAMDLLPVTSAMNTAQLSEYLEEMKEHYRGRGVDLQFPEEWAQEDSHAEALAR